MFEALKSRLEAGGRASRDEAAWLWNHATDDQLKQLAGIVRGRYHAPDHASWLIMAIVIAIARFVPGSLKRQRYSISMGMKGEM